MRRPKGMKLNFKTKMKRITLSAVFALSSIIAFSQGTTMDFAKQAQCSAVEAELTPLLKSAEHPKRSLKSDTWKKLGDAYINSITTCGQDSTAADKALSAYNKAAELEGADGKGIEEIKEKLSSKALEDAFMIQGANYYSAQNMKSAQKAFMTAMKINPKDTLSAFYVGIVSNTLEDEKNTEYAFKEVLARGGTDPSIFYTLGVKAQERKEFDIAIKYFKDGIVKNPESSDLKSALINAYLAADKLDEAIHDLEEMVKLEPDNVVNMLNLAILYDNKDDDETAMKYYKKVLALDPDNYDTNFNLGVFYFNRAVNDKKEIDDMSMEEYRKRGKEVETKVCKEFREAQPYFEACMRAKPGDDLAGKQLETLKNVLSQCD